MRPAPATCRAASAFVPYRFDIINRRKVEASDGHVALPAAVAKNCTACLKDEETVLDREILSIQKADRAFLAKHACPMLFKTTWANRG
jgi:hypothetical protein